ncbi:MAG: hypothetical protein WA876_16220 [Candidatus Acidiferrales bacterium]
MRIKLGLSAVTIVCLCTAIVAVHAFAAGQDASPVPNAKAEEFIDKARDAVSLRAVGPVEIQADVKIALLKGKTALGTYKLDWAAPDRFRREIHFPGYDEVSVASGGTFYRKRSADFTPLAIFRIEELMSPSEIIAQFQRDEVRATEAAAGFPDAIPVPKPGNVGINADGLATAKETCLTISPIIYQELCTDRMDGRRKLFSAARRMMKSSNTASTSRSARDSLPVSANTVKAATSSKRLTSSAW